MTDAGSQRWIDKKNNITSKLQQWMNKKMLNKSVSVVIRFFTFQVFSGVSIQKVITAHAIRASLVTIFPCNSCHFTISCNVWPFNDNNDELKYNISNEVDTHHRKFKMNLGSNVCFIPEALLKGKKTDEFRGMKENIG